VLSLARATETSLVLTLGALLAEVPHTRPIRLVGGASDPELAVMLGVRPTRYEGPTGIVGVLNTVCRDRRLRTGSLWANVPHYISGIENPKASLALVRRVLAFIGADVDLSDLEDAGRQFDQNLSEVVAKNGKIRNYIAKLEARTSDEEAEVRPSDASDLPPASELVAEIEQFLKQQRPE
jgi:proteasome assembly chaperone (PAC2) family protein